MASTLFPEILRSAQKDETILNQMSGEFSRDFWLKILGPKTWLKYNQWIEAFNHFVYFTCTTLSDLQTPGEEYTGLVQVVQDYSTRRPKLPSKNYVKHTYTVVFQYYFNSKNIWSSMMDPCLF